MFECCLGFIIVFCVLIARGPPRDPRAHGPDFGSSEPLGMPTLHHRHRVAVGVAFRGAVLLRHHNIGRTPRFIRSLISWMKRG